MNRLFRQLRGAPSPRGQMPFTDAWYRESDQRMLHAALVCQLTNLPKKLAKRLYVMLQGRPSPRGQMPFTDTWYLENDRRMLHATVVWRLHVQLARTQRSEARALLDVYNAYRGIVNTPQLDLTRAVFVVRLVVMALWQERQCHYCGVSFLAPTDEKHDIACPGCRLYHRYRCHRCGHSLNAQPLGRPRTKCAHCAGGLAMPNQESP